MMNFFKRIFDYIVGNGATEPIPAVQETIPVRKPRFVSLFVLGDDFYNYHKNVDIKVFVKWLSKYRKIWCDENKDLQKSLSNYTFENLIEAIYEKSLGDIDYESLSKHLFKWYIQEHGVFRFSTGERLFLSLKHSHLVHVLYSVLDSEVAFFDSNKNIDDILETPEDYKNNWFIGTNSNNNLERQIADRLIPNVDKNVAHFKFIQDNPSCNTLYLQKLEANDITNFVVTDFSKLTTIPNDDVTKARFNRYDTFNEFSEHAEKKFKDLLKATPKAKRFDDFYMLNVWSDRSNNKNDHIYLNVSFGSRILTVSRNNKGFTSTCEEGARLCFYRMEDGFVSITLYPAKTDQRHPIEDAIVLYEYISPEKLNEDKFVKDCWDKFISYMECTAIDGDPGFCQRRIVSCLRYRKHLIVNGVFQPTKRSVVWNKRWEFITTVALSGCLVALVQFGYNKYTEPTPPDVLNEKLIHHVDSTQAEIKKSIDSIKTVIEIDLDKKAKEVKQNKNQSKNGFSRSVSR